MQNDHERKGKALDDFMMQVSPYVRLAHHFAVGDVFQVEHRVIFDHLLFYTRSGTGWVGIGDRVYRQEPYTLFLIRPGVPHSFHTDTGSSLLMLNLHFDFVEQPNSAHIPSGYPSVSETLSHTELMRPDPTLYPDYALPDKIVRFDPLVYEQCFYDIFNNTSRATVDSRLMVKSAMTRLLAHLYHYQQIHETILLSPSIMNTLDEVSRYMAEKMADSVDLDMLAEMSNMSVSHFLRCFKQYYQTSPMRYFRQMRIETARRYLTQTDLPVKVIANMMGFTSVHHFTRMFTELTGKSPAAYRNTLKPPPQSDFRQKPAHNI